jgi:hypothetical protein
LTFPELIYAKERKRVWLEWKRIDPFSLTISPGNNLPIFADGKPLQG